MKEKITIDDRSTKVLTFDIDDESKFTQIYGLNGVGKTKISRHLKSKGDDFFVFNEDYVHENIYNVEGSQVRSTTGHNQNLAQVFISKQVKKITEIIQMISQLKEASKGSSYLQDILIRNLDKFDSAFHARIRDDIGGIISQYNNLKVHHLSKKAEKISNQDISLAIAELNNWELHITKIEKNFFPQAYLNEIKPSFDLGKLERERSTLKHATQIAHYNKEVEKLKHNENLDKVLCLIKDYNDAIKSASEYYDAIKNVRRVFERFHVSESLYKDPNNDLFNWIKQGMYLHKHYRVFESFCFYCGNEQINLEKWNQKIEVILENSISKISKEINALIEKIKKSELEKILSSPAYEDLASSIPEIATLTQCLSRVRNEHWLQKNILCSVKTQKSVDLKIVSEFFEKIRSQIIKIDNFDEENFRNYVISKIFDELKNDLIDSFCQKLLNKANEFAQKDRITLLEDTERKIRSVLEQLNDFLLHPFHFSVKLTQPHGASKNKEVQLRILDSNHQPLVGRLSTGQRNNLALLLFVAQAKEKIEKKEVKWVVIDDPVDGGDFYAYFLMKSFIMNYFSDQDVKVIILTHNFYYLLIQMHNLEATKHKFQIKKILTTGEMVHVEISDLYSSNKALYYRLTEYMIKNFRQDTSYERQTFVAAWIIWTRKVIEEFLTEHVRLNTGEKIPANKSFKFLLDKIKTFDPSDSEKIKVFLRDKYKGFIAGKRENPQEEISYFHMIEESKRILDLVFGEDKYLEDLRCLINGFYVTESREIFNPEQFFKSSIPCTEFSIVTAFNSAKIMTLAEEKRTRNRDAIKRDISNYLKHAGNSVSQPIIALDVEPLLSLSTTTGQNTKVS